MRRLVRHRRTPAWAETRHTLLCTHRVKLGGSLQFPASEHAGVLSVAFYGYLERPLLAIRENLHYAPFLEPALRNAVWQSPVLEPHDLPHLSRNARAGMFPNA